MSKITLNIHFCAGMSGNTFSQTIMVDKPYDTIHTTFTWDDCLKLGIEHVSDLIEQTLKQNPTLQSEIGTYAIEQITYKNIYVASGRYLIGLQDDKKLADILADFGTDSLEFVYIYVAGGASMHHMGYLFVVHPREQIHAFNPHVHVVRDGISVRYSLDTFKRFPQDKYSREHDRDEKKIIRPYLQKNRDELMRYWNLAMNGYIPPVKDEEGHQYCKES